MERYHIYKLGIAILFYAIYCRRPMVVNGLEVNDSIASSSNDSLISPGEDYYVYYQGVQGKPGIDFPVFSRIPRTSFSCKEVESGYYADLETDCQVFHICNEGVKVSFLCPNGTIFQQSDLICDWWFKVNCTSSPSLYEESAEQLRVAHIRRKASRRVVVNGQQEVYTEAQKSDTRQFSDRKMVVHDNFKYNGGRKSGGGGSVQKTYNYQEDSSDEMQIPQETASFVKNNYNNIQSTRKNPYPNHRETYSDVQSPNNYYTNAPNKPSTVSQKTPINNGRPFVVSTPKVGVYTTEKTTFKYSPTIPTTQRTTTTAAPVTAIYGRTTFGARTSVRNFNNNTYSTFAQSAPRAYSNVDTFTNPPSVANGISTASRKPKSKTSFTIGLNSLQGAVAIKTDGTKITTPRTKSTAASYPLSTKKDVIKLNLRSGGQPKLVKSKGRSYEPSNFKNSRPTINTEIVAPPQLLENEIPLKPSSTNRPTTGFFVTKGNGNTFRPAEFITSDFNSGSITGSQNTYIPTSKTTTVVTTTLPTTTYTEYVSNTYGFVKPTGVPKPKPFELPPSTINDYGTYTHPDDYINPTVHPTYQVSSASPFTNQPPNLPSTYQTYTTPKSIYTVQPTYPTIYSSPQSFTTPQPISDNVYNMLDTLKEIAKVRIAKQEDFENPRPGLIVPPSVGPQTLHTLAVYFANALDSLVPEVNSTGIQAETDAPTTINENLVINSLLSRKTVDKYHELFKDSSSAESDVENEGGESLDEDSTEGDEDNDLSSDHSSNAVQSPRVRQLAKVFTQALSSYLDDPDMFRKVLQQIRPTEPPPLNSIPTESPDEDELLNFSDADIKPDSPRLPTPAPANPTWGYILAFNTTDYRSNHIDNFNDENLQSADSQSFIPGFNELSATRVNKALKDTTSPPKDFSKVTESLNSKNLPSNHWTSSPDVTKLWQTTLYVNPFSINDNFENTETSVSKETSSEDFDNVSSLTHNQSPEVSDFVTESIIDYELRALPKLELNSTEVHGILIDFMNSTKREDSSKLQRILSKLNTTEDEFLSKMKQIEENPLTRRLILLLINECGNNKNEDKTNAVQDLLKYGGSSGESLQPSSTNYESIALKKNITIASTPSAFTKLVAPELKDGNQDTRALQLLNSLYSIASKYGK